MPLTKADGSTTLGRSIFARRKRASSPCFSSAAQVTSRKQGPHGRLRAPSRQSPAKCSPVTAAIIATPIVRLTRGATSLDTIQTAGKLLPFMTGAAQSGRNFKKWASRGLRFRNSQNSPPCSNQQTSKPANQQTSKPANQQTSKRHAIPSFQTRPDKKNEQHQTHERQHPSSHLHNHHLHEKGRAAIHPRARHGRNAPSMGRAKTKPAPICTQR